MYGAQARLAELVGERKCIIEEEQRRNTQKRRPGTALPYMGHGTLGSKALGQNDTLLERETQNLDFVRRRHQRELNQLVNFETLRKEMQVWLFTRNISFPIWTRYGREAGLPGLSNLCFGVHCCTQERYSAEGLALPGN